MCEPVFHQIVATLHIIVASSSQENGIDSCPLFPIAFHVALSSPLVLEKHESFSRKLRLAFSRQPEVEIENTDGAEVVNDEESRRRAEKPASSAEPCGGTGVQATRRAMCRIREGVNGGQWHERARSTGSNISPSGVAGGTWTGLNPTQRTLNIVNRASHQTASDLIVPLRADRRRFSVGFLDRCFFTRKR